MSPESLSRFETRILLVAPTGNDAQNAADVLSNNFFQVDICSDLSALTFQLQYGAAALLIAEEALTRSETAELVSVLEGQEPWSDMSLVIIAGRYHPSNQTPLQLFGDRANINILERPLTTATLISALSSALRARSKQYEVRRLLQEREENMRARELLLQAERLARSEAETANKMKDEFLATVSHELRNPLNSILGFAQILKRGAKSPADMQKGIDVIERNAKAQATLIEDLLDISRMISGKLKLEVLKINFLKILTSAVDSIRPSAAAKEIEIMESYEANSFYLKGDENRLQQIIINLLSNAVKFSKKGGQVKIDLAIKSGKLILKVSDNGIGIEKEFMPFVFDRFRQESQRVNRSAMGLGLGLSIAKKLTEMHNGDLTAESAGSGHGATFTLTLPLPEDQFSFDANDERSAVTVSSYDEIVETVSLKGLNILAVDDEPDSRELIKNILEECGAIVKSAGSAKEALELLQKEVPDLILSDIGMPVEDGYWLIKEVRKLPKMKFEDVPAIALTAFARKTDKYDAYNAGFQAHLAKPVSAQKLVDLIYSLCNPVAKAFGT